MSFVYKASLAAVAQLPYASQDAFVQLARIQETYNLCAPYLFRVILVQLLVPRINCLGFYGGPNFLGRCWRYAHRLLKLNSQRRQSHTAIASRAIVLIHGYRSHETWLASYGHKSNHHRKLSFVYKASLAAVAQLPYASQDAFVQLARIQETYNLCAPYLFRVILVQLLVPRINCLGFYGGPNFLGRCWRGGWRCCNWAIKTQKRKFKGVLNSFVV